MRKKRDVLKSPGIGALPFRQCQHCRCLYQENAKKKKNGKQHCAFISQSLVQQQCHETPGQLLPGWPSIDHCLLQTEQHFLPLSKGKYDSSDCHSSSQDRRQLCRPFPRAVNGRVLPQDQDFQFCLSFEKCISLSMQFFLFTNVTPLRTWWV